MRACDAGDLPAGADPDAVVAALVALLPGYVLQRVLTGQPDRDTFVAGLRALLAPEQGAPMRRPQLSRAPL